MKINCPECNQEYDVHEDWINQTAECETCNHEFTIAKNITTPKSLNKEHPNYNYPITIKNAIMEFQNLASNIIYDGKISDNELKVVVDWININIDYIDKWPLNKIYNVLQGILENGKVSDDERKLLFDELSMVANNNKSLKKESTIFDKNTDITFRNKKFIFTGELKLFTNEQANSFIIKRGGSVADGISSMVDYMVVGKLSDKVLGNNKLDSKLANALSLRDKGIDIFIISENAFAKAAANL
jgi:NAD-dependent DNA ligase